MKKKNTKIIPFISSAFISPVVFMSNSAIAQGEYPVKYYKQINSEKDIDYKDSSEKFSTISDQSTSQEKEIIVTGTHIKGVNTSVGSQLLSIGQEEIKRAGQSTLREVFETLPQNFGGGATGEFQANRESAANVGQGTTINLRGLGSVTTLVLLNGRRLPAGGFNNTSVDISILPMSAIDRIEVLPDGASAVYGSDAVAGVVNFILKENYEGIETSFRYGYLTDGPLDEYQANLLAGRRWESGSVLIAYEYYRRDRLQASDIPFAETTDFRKKGGRDWRFPFANPGTIVDPVTLQALYSVPSGQDGRNLTRADLLPPQVQQYRELNEGRDIFPKQERHSVFIPVRQEIAEAIDAYIEIRYSYRKFNSRNGDILEILPITSENPFHKAISLNQDPIYVAYSFDPAGPMRSKGHVESYGAVAGITINYFDDWIIDLFGSINKENTYENVLNSLDYNKLFSALSASNIDDAFNPFADANKFTQKIYAEIFHNKQKLYIDSDIDQVQLVTSGPLFTIRDQTIRGAAGVDIRREKFSRHYAGIEHNTPAKLKRDVTAFFGEIFVPVIATDERRDGLNSLELSASLRYEKYKDKSIKPVRSEKESQSSTDPRVGLTWQVLPSLRFKGSYGTSFRAPGLSTLATLPAVSATFLSDPMSSSGVSYALIVNGINELKNETATTWTAGVEAGDNNLRLLVNYFSIEFKDQIDTPFASSALSDPALGSIVNRDPTVEDVQRACALAPEGRRNGCTAPDLIQAIIDGRTTNFARTNIEGIDFQLAYYVGLSQYGELNLGVNATSILKFDNAYSPNAPLTSRLDRPNYPLDFRFRSNVSWNYQDNTNVSLFVNYTDKYFDEVNRRKISSHVTVDAAISYKFGEVTEKFSVLGGLTVQLVVNNIFDNSPPFYENTSTFIPYDPSNFDPLGRFIALNVTKAW